VDDNISIKAGTNPDALGLPGCQNIVIQNCNCLRSAWSGITIGSQIGGTVSNVFVENCTVNNSLNAHYIKGNGNLGGGVENVYIRSNQVYTCRTVFCLSPDAYTVPGSQGPPIFSNYNMQGVSCVESLDEPFLFTGDARRPISDVNLSDIAIQATNSKKAGVITNTTDLSAVGITIKGVPVTVSG
jgi:polygalacturonase